jgi:GrpB-like predicted nucleotidyltransferase (UPF0157 family)
LASTITSTVGDDVERIDHIGSTAVPGLAAKATIDIQVTVASLMVCDRWREVIGPLQRRDISEDHVPPGGTPGPDWRKGFWSSNEPEANLHVREVGRANQRYALLFRDYLRATPAAAEAYARAKRRLAELCEDTGTYAEAKDPVCDLIMGAAEYWALAVGWTAPIQGFEAPS